MDGDSPESTRVSIDFLIFYGNPGFLKRSFFRKEWISADFNCDNLLWLAPRGIFQAWVAAAAAAQLPWDKVQPKQDGRE